MRQIRIAAMVVLLLGTTTLWAQETVRMLIGAPPGGGTDVLFRTLARQAGEKLGANIVPLNVSAAGGSMVLEQLMRAQPNGTVLGALANSTLTATPHLIKVPFEQEDYLPLLQVTASPYAICVGASIPANTAAEFVEQLRANPDRFTVGTDPGIGQLSAGRIFKALNANARIVPFRGASEIVVAFLGGHIDIYQGSIPVILPYVASGRARCVMVTGAERSTKLPDASSLAELGIANEATTLTRLLVVHKSTPAAVQKRVMDAFESAATSEETKQVMEAAGDTLTLVKGAELRKALQQEYQAFEAVAKRIGAKP